MKSIIVCTILFVAAVTAQPISEPEHSEGFEPGQLEGSPRHKRFILFKILPIFVQSPPPEPVVRVAAQPVTPIVTRIVKPAPVTVTKVVSRPAVTYQYTPVTYTYRAVVPQVSIVKQATVVSEANVVEETNGDDESFVVEKTKSKTRFTSTSDDDDNNNNN